MEDVNVLKTAEEAGRAAAGKAAEAILAAMGRGAPVRMVLASAPSQASMLTHLTADTRIDWTQVQLFHMDEYLGLDMEHPQAFGQWLVDRLPPEALDGFERIRTTESVEDEARRYSDLISAAPIDVVCLGVGVNGHIAFNEPGDTDFNDQRLVRKVTLDMTSRQQQVDDGLFPSVADVPSVALSLTVPALMSAGSMVCTILGSQKADAVARALTGKVSTECPATILRTHDDVSWFLDEDAASGLGQPPVG